MRQATQGLAALVVCASVASAAPAEPHVADEAEAVCHAGDVECGAGFGAAARPDEADGHPWPQPRGPPRFFGTSPHRLGTWPCNLSASLAWAWRDPRGRAAQVMMGGPVIDGQLNIYVSSVDTVWKFSKDGGLIWTVSNLTKYFGLVLGDGVVVTALHDGVVIGLSMASGTRLWSTKVGPGTGEDGGQFGYYGGAVIGTAHTADCVTDGDLAPGYNQLVFALNSSDGSRLWEFETDRALWNFVPSFAEDGTMTFQDIAGGVYRLNASTGGVIWRGGKRDNATWTDGGSVLGANGIVYAVSSTGTLEQSPFGLPGHLSAYSFGNGGLVWERRLEQSVYSWPAVTRTHGGKMAVTVGVGSLAAYPLLKWVKDALRFGVGLPGILAGLIFAIASAVCVRRGRPSGARAWFRRSLKCYGAGVVVCALLFLKYILTLVPWSFPTSLQSFDAETGEPLWRWDMPTWHWLCAAGDERNFMWRTLYGHKRNVCLPSAMSIPIVDADGVFWIGHMDGHLYGVRDLDGDRSIDADREVCRFDAGGSFFGSGPAFAEGMMAIRTCEALHVFRA